MKHLAMLLASILTVGTLTAAAHADRPLARINGIGKVTMEATEDDDEFGAIEEGDEFSKNGFVIGARVYSDGSAKGAALFVFGEEFSSLWGADVVTLRCRVEEGTVSDDGTVVLKGLSFEQDFLDRNIIFTEYTPFEIVVSPSRQLTLRWCLLPSFDLEIIRGRLKVR